MDTPTSPILTACALLGGQAGMARALDVTPAAVNQWCKGLRSVPAERCPEIERATGGKVRCEELRPDVAWEVLREQVAPSEATAQPLAEPITHAEH